jgi:RES domain-containing protein
MLRLWRLCRRVHGTTAFSGEGARRASGRWNHRGTSVAYATSTLSLAVLELFVHVDPDDAPDDLVAIEAHLPDDVVTETIDVASLPADWRAIPGPDALKDIGSAWVRTGRAPVLIVPSAIVPEESNFLLNPAHPDAGRLRVVGTRSFTFDPRMWK